MVRGSVSFLSFASSRAFSSTRPSALPGVKKRPPNGPKPLRLPPADTTWDHRDLATQLSLFTGNHSSPGSPFFHPDGAHLFHKLQEFLRAQYPQFGLREVITPDLYTRELWEQSGHWQNYNNAMFSVEGGPGSNGSEDPQYSLKPMNCPGHCLLYKSQKRSFRDLPIRYADFSPLHRNELSGTLSGLTRVRRFHQDDGHIFCTPEQVEQEIKSTLHFLNMAYTVLNIRSIKLVLSTRPEKDYLGTLLQWKEAEGQLRQALNGCGKPWEYKEGDGAFYGPKIDIILQDADGKEHQTATIQLDFQLPRRLELKYHISNSKEPGIPVLIHRAIFGSLERFIALLIEKYKGHWPFWLSPRQMIILTVGDDKDVLEYAEKIRQSLTGLAQVVDMPTAQPLNTRRFFVDIDLRDETAAKKMVDAKAQKYNIICFVGKRNVREKNLDIDITGQPRQEDTLKVFERVRPGTVSPVQGVLAYKIRKGHPGVKVDLNQLQNALRRLEDQYL